VGLFASRPRDRHRPVCRCAIALSTSEGRKRLRSACEVHVGVESRVAVGILASHSDRFRERLRIRSWCLTSTDSATTERAPPGPANRATVARRCRNRTARSRTAQCYQVRDTGEECSGLLEFAIHTDLLRTTGVGRNWRRGSHRRRMFGTFGIRHAQGFAF
jgi:hypothetical protein